MNLVCGIGILEKTIYCKFMEHRKGIPRFSIKELKENAYHKTEKESLVHKCERSDIEQIHKGAMQGKYILEGNICFMDSEKNVKRISEEIFFSYKISKIYMIQFDEETLAKRINEKLDEKWTIRDLLEFQNEESRYAEDLAIAFGVELEIVDLTKKECIILPIAPIYVSKILQGEKKYEFRKKLAQKEIKKIFIYATAPIKMIVGEVEVMSKISMSKNDLWQKTFPKGCVTSEYYFKYFEKQKQACAYELGDIVEYKNGLALKDIGIHFAPQSFIYSSEY